MTLLSESRDLLMEESRDLLTEESRDLLTALLYAAPLPGDDQNHGGFNGRFRYFLPEPYSLPHKPGDDWNHGGFNGDLRAFPTPLSCLVSRALSF